MSDREMDDYERTGMIDFHACKRDDPKNLSLRHAEPSGTFFEPSECCPSRQTTRPSFHSLSIMPTQPPAEQIQDKYELRGYWSSDLDSETCNREASQDTVSVSQIEGPFEHRLSSQLGGDPASRQKLRSSQEVSDLSSRW